MPEIRFFSKAIPIKLGLVVGLLLGWVASVLADVAPPAPMPMRVAQAEVVIEGEIVGFLDQDLNVLASPKAKKKTPYRVAVIRIRQAFVGSKKGKTLRAGYPAPKPDAKPNRFTYRVAPLAKLKTGQKAILFLSKHPSGKFYQTVGFYSVVVAPQKTTKFYTQQLKHYQKQINEIQVAAKVLANPIKSLQSKDASLRLTAAAMYIARYRAYPRVPPVRTEAIDAKKSQLILNALLKADWTKKRNFNEINPMTLFFRLGITKKDGFVVPRTVRRREQIAKIAQAWLRENANTYRIKRFVGGKRAKK